MRRATSGSALQSAGRSKNSCKIIPFCRKVKTLGWPEECSQEEIVGAKYGRRSTMTLHTQMRESAATLLSSESFSPHPSRVPSRALVGNWWQDGVEEENTSRDTGTGASRPSRRDDKHTMTLKWLYWRTSRKFLVELFAFYLHDSWWSVLKMCASYFDLMFFHPLLQESPSQEFQRAQTVLLVHKFQIKILILEPRKTTHCCWNNCCHLSVTTNVIFQSWGLNRKLSNILHSTLEIKSQRALSCLAGGET